MKLRLVLFLSCTLLFSCLSSSSLNAQQEGEARLWLTTALPTLAAKGAKPQFGRNIMVFDPSMSSQAIQKQIDAVYATQEHNEFGQQRNALLFLPGDYSVDVPVGFYTEVIGLGRRQMQHGLRATCMRMRIMITTMPRRPSGELRKGSR